jgi:hypothetical protein
MKRKFKPVPSPFGVGVDEKATHEAFVAFVGSTDRADRLQRIWNNSYPGIRASAFATPATKTDVFRRKAKAEGFTVPEIDAFLSLT